MARETERWVYAGRRLDGKGKTFHAWYDPKTERTLHFGKVPAHTIGEAYDVDVDRDGDSVVVYGDAKFANAGIILASAELVAGWRAEDADARHEIESKRAEKRAAADSDVEEALDVLRNHFQSCKSYSAKWGFAQWVAAEVARPPRGDR